VEGIGIYLISDTIPEFGWKTEKIHEKLSLG
jgi:hypothetical protein